MAYYDLISENDESTVVIRQQGNLSGSFNKHICCSRNDGTKAVKGIGLKGIEVTEVIGDDPYINIAFGIDTMLKQRPAIAIRQGGDVLPRVVSEIGKDKLNVVPGVYLMLRQQTRKSPKELSLDVDYLTFLRIYFLFVLSLE